MHFFATRFPRWRTFVVCAALVTSGIPLVAEDWPEWRGKGRAGVWNESGVIDTFPSAGLPVRWRTPIHAGYAGPAVAGGRVFVTDSRRIKANQAIERAVAIDEQSGRILWTHEWETDYSGLQLVYAIGPRATPTVDDDRVYVLGAIGSSRRARCEERPGAVGKGLRRRLQCVGSVLGHGGRAAGRRRSPDLPRRRRAERQGDRARQAHGQGDLASAVVGHRARLQPADHRRRRRRAATDPLSSRRLQLARSVDGKGVLGDRASRADGDRRRHAGAQRTLPVLHVAVRRGAHAHARRARSPQRPCCGAVRESRIPA